MQSHAFTVENQEYRTKRAVNITENDDSHANKVVNNAKKVTYGGNVVVDDADQVKINSISHTNHGNCDVFTTNNMMVSGNLHEINVARYSTSVIYRDFGVKNLKVDADCALIRRSNTLFYRE